MPHVAELASQLAHNLPSPMPLTHATSHLCAICQQAWDAECSDGWREAPEATPAPVAMTPNRDGSASVMSYAAPVRRCPRWLAYQQQQRLALALGRGQIDEEAMKKLDWLTVTVDKTDNAWREAREIGKHMALAIDAGANIVLSGLVGRGKTLAAVLMVREAIKQGFSGLAVEWGQFFAEYKEAVGWKHAVGQAGLLDTLKNPQVLLLDEIGLEDLSDWDAEKSRRALESVIIARHDKKKVTIITTNRDETKLEELVGERAGSRINRNARVLFFAGQDFRSQQVSPEWRTFIRAISGK